MTCFLNGQPVFNPIYHPPLWEDARVPATATNLGGSKDPTFTKFIDDGAGSQGVFTYDFSAMQEQELYFMVQLSHSWLEGSTLKPHVHWSPTNTDTGVVRWGLEYTVAKPTSVFPTTTLIYIDDAALGIALEHQIAVLPDIQMVGNTISTMLICRIFRDATHASDTYNAVASLAEIDFHYQLNTPGSRQEFIK